MTKILVIEDAEALLTDIVEMLTLEGFDTYKAENGKKGIEIAEQQLPDLIVCDIRMPVMDGYEVLEHVRSNDKTANIPFIFLTARSGRSEIREGMELGADDYLTKPFTAEELFSSIHTRLLRSSSVQDETNRKMDQLRKSITLALPHEMRTPLNSILGFSDILITDSAMLSSDQIADMAGHINHAAHRLYHLVEKYVVYANLEILRTDQQSSERIRTGITEYAPIIIEQKVREKAIQYDREHDLHVTIPEQYDLLAIEINNLIRIVQEIADNAFKFSKVNTPVQLDISATNEFLTFRIQDHGIGMSPEEVNSIGAFMQFERAFFEQQGLGFGLTIAKRMTEIHNGTFNIDTQLGNGTTVTITLPFQTSQLSVR